MRLNGFIFVIYVLISVSVLAVTVAVPSARPLAYAPLRELLLPPPQPITLSVLYSTEKEAWLKQAAAGFDGRVDGRPIKLALKSMGSREIYLAVLDGKEKPDVIGPASSLQISILQELSTRKLNTSLVRPGDRATCRSTLNTPLVLVAWKQRADALWGTAPGLDLWKRLHDALANPKGWEAFGHAEWGYVKFGHTDPLKSNSGFMTILLMTYDYLGKTNNLSSADVVSNPAYQKWFGEIERSISKFEDSTGTYMQNMVAYGPSTYDLAAVYEASAIEQASNAQSRYGELRVYYPPTTIMSDHPFCALTAEWVTPEKARAAQMLIDYLTSERPQQLALQQHGFRPVNPAVRLDQPDSPFTRYAANGLRSDLPPIAPVPNGDVLNTLLDFWARTAAR